MSPSTVSRSFNHPELVKPQTRKRIDAAVRRLGYIRNRAAQTIHGIRSGTIGLVVPTIDHAIFAELIQSFSDTVETYGFTILLATHGYSLEKEYEVVRKLLEHRVDGLALIGVEHSEDTFGLIAQQAVPAILLWNHAAAARLPCIGASNRAAGQRIAEHLVATGHREIALVFPPTDGNDRAADRLAGVMDVLTEAGVDVPDPWRLSARYSISDAKRCVTGLLQGARRPRAILCGNDVLAWGAVHAAKAAGLDVPRDIAVAGIGDFNGSKEFEPGLTTVGLPAPEIGMTGAEVLARAIVDPGEEVRGHVVPCRLHVRRSCGADRPDAEQLIPRVRSP